MISKTIEAYGLSAQWDTETPGLVSLLTDSDLSIALSAEELAEVISILVEAHSLIGTLEER